MKSYRVQQASYKKVSIYLVNLPNAQSGLLFKEFMFNKKVKFKLEDRNFDGYI